MKTISHLTDESVLGIKSKLSQKSPRMTARAIVTRPDGNFALIYLRKFNTYTLPGGGIEIGETPDMAVRREVREETGCVAEDIAEIGIVSENRGRLDYTQLSHFYLVSVSNKDAEPQLTQAEMDEGTEVEWHTFDEIKRLISSANHTSEQRKYIQAREIAAIKEYERIFMSKE